MDVTLLGCSVFDIPSSRRVGAIVHDGTMDMRLWPGPGWDRELNEAYGPGLAQQLEARRKQLGRDLEACETVRVHPGRLHCDMLVWVATRGAEPGAERQPAPTLERIESAVRAVLDFVAERAVARVAFPALGQGPAEADPADRLAAVVRAASAYQERCFAEGRAPVVEEVLVCDGRSQAISRARRAVSGLARAAEPDPRVAVAEKKPSKPRAAAGRPRPRGKKGLDPEEVSRQRVAAEPYDRARAYGIGDWMAHPRFGAGRVERVTQEGHIEVLFEDGETRKMLHRR